VDCPPSRRASTVDDAPAQAVRTSRRGHQGEHYGRRMRRLFPTPSDDVNVADEYADPGRRGRAGRPWVICVMISSLDGAVTVEGRSGGLGGPGDHAVFSAMRNLADAIIVGAGTVRAEKYGPPKRAGQRIGVVTRTTALNFDTALFRSGAGFVVTTTGAPPVPVKAVRAGRDDVDLGAALTEIGGSVVVCEGGPTLNQQMLADDLIDEWCLTISPMLVGGGSERAITDAPEKATAFRLAHVLEEDGSLFARYVRAG
jgi:riboflavin biosynthesis pyrimidine reductase